MLLLILAAVGILVSVGLMLYRQTVEATLWAAIESEYCRGVSIKQIARDHGFGSDLALLAAIEDRRRRSLWHIPHRPRDSPVQRRL